jgi:salicylate hydroxylase
VSSPRTVVIAGAGIGGLTAAIALAQRGFRVSVIEQAERLEAIGAGSRHTWWRRRPSTS